MLQTVRVVFTILVIGVTFTPHNVHGIVTCALDEWCCEGGPDWQMCDRCCDKHSFCASGALCCDWNSITHTCIECCPGDRDWIIVTLAVGIPLLFIIGLIACCCFWPGCPVYRRRKGGKTPPQVIVIGGDPGQHPPTSIADGGQVNPVFGLQRTVSG